MSIDVIEQGLQASDNYLAQLDQLIKAQILASWPDKIPGVDGIARALDSLVAQSETVLRASETEIKTQIDPLIRNAIPSALDFLQSITQSLDSHLSQLLSNLATTEDVLGSAISVAKAHAPELARWIYDNVAGSFGNIALGVLKEMEGQEGEGINALLDHLLSLKGAPPYFTKLLEGFRNRGAEWQALALPAVLVGALLGVIEATQEPLSTVVRQDAYNVFPTKVTPVETLVDAFNKGLIPQPSFEMDMLSNGYDLGPQGYFTKSHQARLEPRDSANLAFRNLIDQGQALAEMRLRGLTPEYAALMFELARPLLPEDAIRNSYLRGRITAEAHDAALQQYGYTSSVATILRELYFFIPPVQDLIHMGIRNVFTPELVERFTLSGDYPKAFEDAARQQGVSPEWALKYWQAHWIMPGREAFFEMFQRTVDEPLDPNADPIKLTDGKIVYNIIGRDTLNLALRDIDTPPFYRDKLTQVAFRPITRIDIRRLESVGLLDFAGVERAYLNLGYSHSDALKLAEFTQKLNSKVKKDEAAALIDGVRKQALRLWVQGKLGDTEVAKTLVDIGFTDAEIETFQAEALLVARADRITAIESRIGKLYIAGIIDAIEATKRLESHDIPQAAITMLLATWDLDIEYRGGTEHILKHRELTKGEIVEGLIDGMIDQSTATSMIVALGYDQIGAEAEVALALFKQAKATKKTKVDAIKASYINGVIEQLDASNRLDALLIPGDQRDSYLSEWTLTRETRTERIPIATIRDMLIGEYLTEPDAFVHLKRHRFTDADVDLLIKFWQKQPRPKRLVNA